MKKCTIKGCNNEIHGKGLCQKHYMQQRRGTLDESTKRSTEDIIANLGAYKQEIANLAEIFRLLTELLDNQ